jgi:hypothetical protein
MATVPGSSANCAAALVGLEHGVEHPVVDDDSGPSDPELGGVDINALPPQAGHFTAPDASSLYRCFVAADPR